MKSWREFIDPILTNTNYADILDMLTEHDQLERDGVLGASKLRTLAEQWGKETGSAYSPFGLVAHNIAFECYRWLAKKYIIAEQKGRI